MPMLTREDREFYDRHGYVRIRDVIPHELCDAVVAAIFEFLGFDPNNPRDWYRAPLKPSQTVIELYHHQSMWDVRQHPRMHATFAELWGTEKLHVSQDRVSFKPPHDPNRPEWEDKGFFHLDSDPCVTQPKPRFVQGVLYLADTGADQGGFHCVPGFHKLNEAYSDTPRDRRPPEPPAYKHLAPTPIVGRKGDLVLWDNFTPHGPGRNTSTKPRLAQYVAMQPVDRFPPELREGAIRQWRERKPPNSPAFPGDPRKLEEVHGKSATLTPLGEKLIGLRPW